VARPYGASAVPEENPLAAFAGFGFSTQTHAAGVSPYPASTAENTHNVYNDMPEGKYPFDERKNGLKETMHSWKKWDWKKNPSEAIDEVNVWGNNGLPGTQTSDDAAAGADTSWNLGDKMTFAWKHWKEAGHAQVCTCACVCTCAGVCVGWGHVRVVCVCVSKSASASASASASTRVSMYLCLCLCLVSVHLCVCTGVVFVQSVPMWLWSCGCGCRICGCCCTLGALRTPVVIWDSCV